MRKEHSRRLLIGWLTAVALTVPAAGATAASIEAPAVESAGVQVPSVPKAPAVPRVPSTPSLPNVPSAPSAPSAPSVPSTPSLPSTPSAPSVPSTPSAPAAPSLDAGSGVVEPQAAPVPTAPAPQAAGTAPAPAETEASSDGDSDSEGGSSSGSKRSDVGGRLDEPTPAERRAQRFERKVRELRACLSTLPPKQWSFAVMRTGIHSGLPLSRAQVARRLDLGPAAVRSLERTVLRNLRAAARFGGCEGEGASASSTSGVASLILTSTTKGSAATTVAVDASGKVRSSGDGGDDGDDGGRPSGEVAGVFERSLMPAGLGGSLVDMRESVSAVAVGAGILLITLALLHLNRRRTQ